MSEKTWTKDAMATFAAVHGLKDAGPEELARMVERANKVAATSAAIPRMPSKGHEPASTFKVPL